MLIIILLNLNFIETINTTFKEDEYRLFELKTVTNIKYFDYDLDVQKICFKDKCYLVNDYYTPKKAYQEYLKQIKNKNYNKDYLYLKMNGVIISKLVVYANNEQINDFLLKHKEFVL